MRILAIETSCDETAIALLEIEGSLQEPEIKVLGNSLLSQAKLHEEYGGVYPDLAKREHKKNLPILLEKTLEEAGYPSTSSGQVDFIAVTSGPGLEPALWTGITFAEDLGKKWSASGRKVPVVPVNHMLGHVYSVLLKGKLEFPALALLVSGGHTELVYIKDFGQYQVLGETRDDAVGEAFDKVARMLGLPYPGGPEISRLAEKDREESAESKIDFPRPMIHSGDLNFSFSGLKTAVLYYLKANKDADRQTVARAFEDAAVGVLIEKTHQALDEHETKSLIIAGGVSANKHLQTESYKLAESFPGLSIHIPSQELSTDNAVMIGVSAFVNVNLDKTILDKSIDIEATGNLGIPQTSSDV